MVGRNRIGVHTVLDRGFSSSGIGIDSRTDVLAEILLAREGVAEVARDSLHGHRTQFQRQGHRRINAYFSGHGGYGCMTLQAKADALFSEIALRLGQQLLEDWIRRRLSVRRTPPLLEDLSMAFSAVGRACEVGQA